MRGMCSYILVIALAAAGCEIRTYDSRGESGTNTTFKKSCDDCDCCSELSRADVLSQKKEDLPAVELKTVKFDAFMKDVKAQAGKVVCAYQWSNANAASKKNLPILLDLQRKLGKDVVLVTASSDFAKDRSAALKHLESIRCVAMNYWEDENDTVDGWTSCFGCCGFPGLVIFGRDGKKATSFEATELPFDPAVLEKTLVKLLKVQ